MKRTLASISAASMLLGTFGPVAFASTSKAPAYSYNNRTIAIGTYSSNVKGTVANDAGHQTEFVPFYYVQAGLNKLGYTVTWDGYHLDITTPSTASVDLSNLNPGNGGAVAIRINGTVVQYGPRVVAGDPFNSNKPTSFMPIWYLNAVLGRLGYTNSYDGQTWKVWTADYTISGNNNVAVGGKDTLSLTSKSTTIDASKVTWSLDGAAAGKAFIDNAGNFTANTAGTYNVTARYNGVSVKGKVSVFGQASGVKLAAAGSTLVANGQSTDRVTVNVVDANGNTVTNFNGTVNVLISGSAVTGTLASGVTQDTDYSAGTVTITNGTGTFLVGATSTPGLESTISASGLVASGSITASTIDYTSTATIDSVQQVATGIKVTPAKTAVEVNDNNDSVAETVQVVDQAGQPMLGGTYVLSESLSGGGSFASNSVVTTQTVVNTNGPDVSTATVWGRQNQQGTYTLTVTASGLTSGVGTVKAAVAGNPVALTATDATTTFVQGSATGTTITVGAVDVNGNVVSTSATPELVITDSKGNVVSGLAVSGASFNSGTNAYVAATSGAATFTITDTATGTADAGTYTVAVKDSATSNALTAAPSLTITEQASTAAEVKVTQGTSVLTPGHLSDTVSLQVTDAFGNPVTTSGVAVNVSASGVAGYGSAEFNGGTYATAPTATVTTDATGKATFTFGVQDYNNATWTVAATTTASGITVVSPASVTYTVVDHSVASYSFTLKDLATTGSYAGSSTYALTGHGVGFSSGLIYDGKDANGNAVASGTASVDNVTVTINHASGLANLNTTGLTVATSGDVETITGSLGTVDAAFTTATAAKAGEVTISLKDNSTGATGSASIDVVADTNHPAIYTFSGLTANEKLTQNQAYAVTVTLADIGGNTSVAATTETVTISGSVSGLVFEDANHIPTNTVTIAPGQSSATFYVIASTSGITGATVSVSDGASPADTGSVTGLND